MAWRFGEDQLQRRSHRRFDDMTAVRGAVCFADDDVSVQLWCAILTFGNVPD